MFYSKCTSVPHTGGYNKRMHLQIKLPVPRIRWRTIQVREAAEAQHFTSISPTTEQSAVLAFPALPDTLRYTMLAFLRGASPSRTQSAASNPVVYDDGRSSVTFREPDSEYSMTHTISPETKHKGASILTPPFHYHIYQDEHFRVTSGTGAFYLGLGPAPFAVLSSGPGKPSTTTIKAGRYHRFENASETEDLIVDIKLAPEAYESEQRFFRNFFGYLDDCRKARAAPSLFQLLVFLHSADTPLAVPLPLESLGKVASRILLTATNFWGRWVLGYKDTYPEYYDGGKSK